MNNTKKDQQKEQVVGIAGISILLYLLMVIILFGIDIRSDNNRESQVGEVSYVTQLEWLAESKGYTKEDKFTYKERQQLETEDVRYQDAMKYLEGVEVSESEFQEIKEIQSKYQQSEQQVNNSGLKDYSLLIAIMYTLLTIFLLFLLIKYAQIQ